MAKLSKAQLISKAFGSKGQFAAVVGTKAERSSGIVLNKSAALTASAGMTSIASWNDYDSKRQYFDGDLLFVLDVRRTYMSDGKHWYLFSDAVTNQAPTTITGANASYDLATDGTPIVLTLQSSDPEGIAALNWSYAVTTGTLGDTATISQGSGANINVFTITPSTTEAHAGTFSVTFSVTDGNSITTQVVDFTLNPSPPIYDTIQTISNPSATPDYDKFGYAVDVNNSGTMVIGAYGAGTLPWPTGTPDGKAYIYDNTGSLVSTLSNPSPGGVGPGSGPMDWFGTHVSIGNYVAVTATQDDYSSTYTDTGAVYIFSTSGSYLRKIANPQPNDSQLRDVKMSGSYAIIANKNYNLGGYTGIDGTWHSGAVYVYNAGNGSLTRTIMNPNPYGTVQLDYFGAAIAVDGNKLMVYAAGEDDAAGDLGGSVYVYNNFLSGGPDHTITNPNPYGTRNSDNFGNYMDIYGNYAVIAAHSEDDSDGTNVGSAYIYETTNWTVLHTLVNPNPDGVTANDYFGRGVAINSEYCFVNADEGSTGGVVYVYKNSTGEFMTKIENPNQYDTPTGDRFGKAHALAVSDNGNYLAVGAGNEDAASGSNAGVAFLITSSNPNAPVSITGVNSTYEIAYSGSALVITAISSDPDGSALTWSYSISGLTNNEATVSQSGNVFTVTPSGLISNLGTFALTIEVTDGGYTVTQTTDITVATIYAAQTQKIQVSSYDLNGKIAWDDDGNTLIIGADTDRAFIWHRTGDVWTQAAVLQPQSQDTSSSFGAVYSGLSMSGDGMTAVVGGIGIDHSDTSGAWGSWASAGGIYIYKRTGNSWSQQARIESPIVMNSIWFSRSTQLSRDGNVLIVNSQAPNNNTSSSGNYAYGKSFLYTRSGNTWSLIQTLAPAGSSHQYFQFGKFQALSGDGKHAVFCNWGDGWPSTQDGSLSFWKRTTGAFTNLISRTKATAWTAGDHYGERLALDYLGETCVVGTPLYDSGKGNVHVWTRSGNSWSQQQDISNPLSTGSFGSDVDITSDGNMIIIGASGSNKIYIYERSGSTWTETASFDADDTTSGDQLGKFVQVSDNKDKFIASSPGQTDGATYYFKKS